MPTIHLGIQELPYSLVDTTPVGNSDKSKSDMTTGDVAEILEENYGVMEHFWERHEEDAVNAISDSLSSAFEAQLDGAPFNVSALEQGAKEVENLFKKFLENREMDGLVGGVPTLAAIKGISHRPKSVRKTPWVSFIDSGLYESSFRCWVD